MVASWETAAEVAVAFLADAGVVSNQAGHPRDQWMESATQQQGLVGAVQLLEYLKQRRIQSTIRGSQEHKRRIFIITRTL